MSSDAMTTIIPLWRYKMIGRLRIWLRWIRGRFRRGLMIVKSLIGCHCSCRRARRPRRSRTRAAVSRRFCKSSPDARARNGLPESKPVPRDVDRRQRDGRVKHLRRRRLPLFRSRRVESLPAGP